MNSLRKDIDTQINKVALKGSDGDYDDVAIDAILDAVVKALPELKQVDYMKENQGKDRSDDYSDRFFRYGGYDFAIKQIRRIFNDAKEKS